MNGIGGAGVSGSLPGAPMIFGAVSSAPPSFPVPGPTQQPARYGIRQQHENIRTEKKKTIYIQDDAYTTTTTTCGTYVRSKRRRPKLPSGLHILIGWRRKHRNRVSATLPTAATAAAALASDATATGRPAATPTKAAAGRLLPSKQSCPQHLPPIPVLVAAVHLGSRQSKQRRRPGS